MENQIRPWVVGRSKWLFAGSLRAGQRDATAMSLVRTAQLNGLHPHAYMKDVLARLQTQKQSEIGDLLPNRWKPAAKLIVKPAVKMRSPAAYREPAVMSLVRPA